MIAAVVDCRQYPCEKFIFRGRDLGFWLEHFYPFCRFVSLTQPDLNFDFLFVFDTAGFPESTANARAELRQWLKIQDSSKAEVYAPENFPFLIVTKPFLNKQKITLKPGIFKALKAHEKIRRLNLKNSLPIFNPQNEPRKIETAVVGLQISCLLKSGVKIENFGNFYLDGLSPIGKNTIIGSGVTIKGDCQIGKNVNLCANSYIENSQIGDQCVVLPGSVICDSKIEANVQLGPYTHLRNGSLVKKGAKMGNFVEMKKSALGPGSKAMHLSYIGDARVGKNVNIGAGTITCNYDGTKKHPTIIEDNVFIGSGTELVAPVTVHRNSYVAAGSTITEDVPKNALAVARQRQRNIANWVLRKRKKKRQTSP